jgi:hypothetical protein
LSGDACVSQEVLEMQITILSALAEDMTFFHKDLEAILANTSVHLEQKEGLIIHQQALIERIIKNAEVLELSETEYLTLPAYGDFAEELLSKAILLVIDYSKQAIAMVYRLSDVVERLDILGRLVTDVNTVNRKTKMLALNATIEAAHAGNAGVSFQHVAAEVRDLSDTIAVLSQNMQTEIEHVATGVLDTHKMLVQCAAIDTQPMIESGAKLEKLITALLTQQERLAVAKQEAVVLGNQQRGDILVAPLVKNLHTMQKVIALIKLSQTAFTEKLNNPNHVKNLKEDFLAGVHDIVSSLETDMTLLPRLRKSFQQYSTAEAL